MTRRRGGRYGPATPGRYGVPELWTVSDPEGLDERRAVLGLEPEHENRARLLAHYTKQGPAAEAKPK